MVEALHARTGGNPFFLEELVASAGTGTAEDLASMPLPWTVAELVRTQVDELDPEVRRIVTTAAVLGPPGQLRRAGGRDRTRPRTS